MSRSRPGPVSADRKTSGRPGAWASWRSSISRISSEARFLSSTRSHLLMATTSARPSRRTRSAICRSCFSSGVCASTSRTTTSANRMARRLSATESFSSFDWTFAFLRMPAVSKRRTFHSRSGAAHFHSIEMESRVIPASGPVSRRSSPMIRLTSVDLPAFGRPTIATRKGLVGSS